MFVHFCIEIGNLEGPFVAAYPFHWDAWWLSGLRTLDLPTKSGQQSGGSIPDSTVGWGELLSLASSS